MAKIAFVIPSEMLNGMDESDWEHAKDIVEVFAGKGEHQVRGIAIPEEESPIRQATILWGELFEKGIEIIVLTDNLAPAALGALMALMLSNARFIPTFVTTGNGQYSYVLPAVQLIPM